MYIRQGMRLMSAYTLSGYHPNVNEESQDNAVQASRLSPEVHILQEISSDHSSERKGRTQLRHRPKSIKISSWYIDYTSDAIIRFNVVASH